MAEVNVGQAPGIRRNANEIRDTTLTLPVPQQPQVAWTQSKILSSRTIYNTFCAALTLGQAMNTRTKIIALQLLGAMFDLIWIGASIVLVYFLYGVLTNDASWPYLSWSLAVGCIAKQVAAALKNKRLQVDYVGQLTDRGYKWDDAEAAWRMNSLKLFMT